MQMTSFLNQFTAKMILLNVLVNVVISIFKDFLLLIIVIPWNETFLYYRANQISLCFINL